MTKRIRKECEYCGKIMELVPSKAGQKFCSNECRLASIIKYPIGYKCEKCGKPKEKYTEKYCNGLCWNCYYTHYRKTHPEYRKRQIEHDKERERRRREEAKHVAEMRFLDEFGFEWETAEQFWRNVYKEERRKRKVPA